MKRFFKYIICTVTYKNHMDLLNFLGTLDNISDYHVVVINNFFDGESLEKIKEIALEYNCDFINCENKGYGAGNNVGVKFAMDNYDFDYLIISNPDIQIKSFSEPDNVNVVYAPIIRTKSGKNQNPYWCIDNPIAEYILYVGMKYKIMLLCIVAWGVNRLLREIFLWVVKHKKGRLHPVYACHGSFFIIGRKALEKIVPIYDENMFLFSEEALLAVKLKKEEIISFLDTGINVFHSEDGSVSMSEICENEEKRKSYIYYYMKRKSLRV